MPPVSKLTAVQLSDGWSFVTRSKPGRSSKPKSRSKIDQVQTKNVPVDQKHVTGLVGDINRSLDLFGDSACAEKLSSSFSSSQLGNPDYALCLGLGNLDPDSTTNTKRSIAQFAVFVWLVRWTAVQDSTRESKCYAIDPSFTPTDKAILEHFNVSADCEPSFRPAASSGTSMFYAPYLPWPVLTLDYLATAANRPAILVCQNLRSVKENLEMQRLRFNDVASMIEVDGREFSEHDLEMSIGVCDEVVMAYCATPFPPYDPLPSAFQDLTLYVKFQAEDSA